MHTLRIPLVSLLFKKVVGEGRGHLIQGVGTLFCKKKTTTTTKTKQKQTNKVCQWQERAHNPERAPPILGPYHAFLRTGLFLRRILGHFFSRKWNLHHVYERIRGIKMSKTKT